MRVRESLTERGGFDLWGFFVFSHGWTWFWWSFVIVAGWEAFAFPGVVFLAIGGLGLPMGAVVMTREILGHPGLRDLWQRIVDWRRIPLRWYVVIFGLPAATFTLAAILFVATGGQSSPIEFDELAALLADPVGLLAYAAFVLILGPLPEEIGWRGYLLDRLQARWSAVTASLLLGVAWAAWHAPLFVMPGYFSNLDFAPDPTLFTYQILAGSILYTWVYNNTRRSVLAAILYHFAGNFTSSS